MKINWLTNTTPHHRAMWWNFSSSIGLLAIAMMAALYSSSAGRSGAVLPAAVSAFIALGIAVWVGIRFVPRLAASVDWGWLPFLSHYHVTREGWIYFGAVTVVIFAAINTANNLLYMVLSALLAVLLLSGFLSALNFRFLRIGFRIPSHCFVQESFPITVHVQNEKRAFPSFSINLEPVDDGPFQFSPFYVPAVRGQQQVSQTGQAKIVKRGQYRIREVKGISRFPFGFFVKDRTYKVEADCICYPEIIPHDQMDFAVLDAQGSSVRFEKGFGHDLYMIRDYLPSDSARHVHWKASAKTSVLKTREYAAEESHRIVVAFDRFGQALDANRFEDLVSRAASLAYHLFHAGLEVEFLSDDWQSGPGHSQGVLNSILHYLALVQMSSRAAPPPADARALRLSLRS